VNKVASPLKFSEYCLAGLPIVMTNAVEQSSKIALFLKNNIFYEFQNFPRLINVYEDLERVELAKQACALLSRGSITHKYLNLYSRYYNF
jgi:hypothetical protein